MIARELKQTLTMTASIVALVASLGFQGHAQAAPPEISPAPELQKLNSTFAQLSEKLSPSVINIYTKSQSKTQLPKRYPGLPQEDFDFFFEHPFAPQQEVQALGSGFIIDSEGYIVTNAHVVHMAGKDVDEVMVKFNGEENSRGHAAKIVGVDPATDVAVLKLLSKKDGLQPAKLGDSEKSKVGEWVLAIGNPYGHTHTVTQGIISAKGRSLEGTRTDFLQTSASINPGNSGGPLFNVAGEVVGINTAIDPRAQGIGFAIPINTAKHIITQLKDTGKVKRPWLGISIQNVTEELSGYLKMKESTGVLVSEVVQGTPAEKAGIEPYDIITKVDGKNVNKARDLIQAIEKFPVGHKTKVEVLRNNKAKILEVVLGEQPAQPT